jgi:hypothetical protein
VEAHALAQAHAEEIQEEAQEIQSETAHDNQPNSDYGESVPLPPSTQAHEEDEFHNEETPR